MTNFQCTSNGAPALGFTDPMAASHRIGLPATQRGTTQAQLEQFWAGVKQTRDQQIQNLLNYDSGISTSPIDGNHKTINDPVLRFFASDTLASGDLATLETIAAQCPLEGLCVKRGRWFLISPAYSWIIAHAMAVKNGKTIW